MLDQDVNNFPVIKADLMRYISTFRQQLPKDLILKSVEQLCRYLTSNVPVVHTYACHSIERILTIKSTTNAKENLLTNIDLSQFMPQIMVNTLNILQPITGENEYAMKTLMRLCMCLQEKCVPYLETIIAKLITLLDSISKNPSKPNFNHYLFETFGILIKAVCMANRAYIEQFEARLFPIFNYVLEKVILNFIFF